MARTTVARADVVVVVTTATLTGVNRLGRLIDEALRFGVDADRVLPVVNRAPRSPRLRSDVAGALATAIGALHGSTAPVASPLFLPERRRLDEAHRNAAPLPRSVVEPIGSAVNAMLERAAPPTSREPRPVEPRRLGSWHTDHV
jgi:hypothetical protein